MKTKGETETEGAGLDNIEFVADDVEGPGKEGKKNEFLEPASDVDGVGESGGVN